MRRATDGEDLRRKVLEKGRPKTIRTITIAAEKILSRQNGKRYFRYHVDKDRCFTFEPNEEGRSSEEKLDGKWVIKTTEHDRSFKEVVFEYKDLLEVEDGFRHLKDFIRVAPVHHWRYRRVKAHVSICVLALLLERLLDRKLKEAKIDLSARKALEKRSEAALNKVHTKVLDDGTEVHSFQTLLKLLSAIVRNKCRVPRAGPAAPIFEVVTTPNAKQQKAYDLLEGIRV